MLHAWLDTWRGIGDVVAGMARQDFDLAVTGDLEVNPTLLNALAAEFDCHCDPDELLASAGMEGAIDTAEELEEGAEELLIPDEVPDSPASDTDVQPPM